MLRAASTLPAPSPKGIAIMQSIQKFVLNENPIRAAAVRNILIHVVFDEPSLDVTLSLIKLEKIVLTDTIAEIIPTYEMGTPNSTNIDGHAEPSTESGKPKLINERYIIDTKSINI